MAADTTRTIADPIDRDDPQTTASTLYEGWLTGDHGDIRYWQTRPAHGPPLVLLHGYGGLIEHWQRVLPLLARDYTIYAFDLYNQGYSALLDGTPDKQLWAAQTAQVLTQLVGTPATLIAHSMGGAIAVQTALDYPHLVDRLVLVDTAGMPYEYTASPLEQLLYGILRTPLLGDFLAQFFATRDAVRQNLTNTYANPERVTAEMVELFLGPLRRPGGPAAYLAASRSFERFPFDFAAGAVAQPVLMVWGAEDKYIPPVNGQRIQAQFLPQATVQTIPDSGHCCFDETPEAFCEIVLPWLAQTAAGATNGQSNRPTADAH